MWRYLFEEVGGDGGPRELPSAVEVDLDELAETTDNTYITYTGVRTDGPHIHHMHAGVCVLCVCLL